MQMIIGGIDLNHQIIYYGKTFSTNEINAYMTKDLTSQFLRFGISSYTFGKYVSKLMSFFRPFMVWIYLRNHRITNLKSNILHFHYGNAIRDAYWLSKLGYSVVYTLHQVPTADMIKHLLRIQQNDNFQLVVVSNYLKELLSKAGIQRIKTVLNGIKFDQRIQVTPWTKLSKNRQTKILCIGRFNQEKGLDLLIDCVELLVQKNYKIKCVILGDGPLLKSYLTSIKERKLNEYISLPGFKSDLHSFLVEADLYVQPSRQETFSLSLLEAMAYGKRCIISDGTGMSGVLNGMGLCFSNGSVHDLLEKISDCILNEGKMPSTAKQVAEESRKYDLGQMLRGYDDIYRTI